MSESMLNRDFKEKDVNRLRNLLNMKFGEKTSTQVGYGKKKDDHVEGDVWEENGKSWTIKDGVKQSFTKMDSVKKALRMPLLCPCCNTKMKHRYDSKFFSIHKMCFDCVIKVESRLRMDGKYEEYANTFQIKNAISYINEARIFVNDYSNTSRDIYYSEEGEKQTFVGGSSEDSVVEVWNNELDKMEIELKSKLSENESDKNS
jgi:hypothetical protein